MKTQIKKIKQNKFEIKDKTSTYNSVSMVFYIVIAFLSFFAVCIKFDFFRDFSSAKYFRNFTNLSGALMFFDGVMMAIVLGIARKRKDFKVRKAYTIINFTLTACVTLTMVVTMFVLLPGTIIKPDLAKTTPRSLYSGSNLLYHLVVPVLSIFALLFYAKFGEIKKTDVLYALIPMMAYLIFYITLAYTHVNPETGKPYPYWDNYRFCQFGVGVAIALCFAIPGLYLGLCYLLWFGNKKIRASKFFVNVLVQCVIILLVIGGGAWVNGEQAWETFKYFTNLSAFMLGIATVIYLAYICLEYQGKIKQIPTWVSILKYCTTGWVFLTFFVVVFLFAPILGVNGSKADVQGLFNDRNLIFHVFVPAFGIVSYLTLEHNKLHWKNTFYVLTFATLYIIVYVSLAYALSPKGVEQKYCDWYQLYQYLGKKWTWVLVIGNPLLAYGLGFMIWYLNRRIHINAPKDNNIFDLPLKPKKLIVKN